MKPILAGILLLCAAGSFNPAKSNPIIVYYPQAYVSELLFTSPSVWQLEMELWVPEEFLIAGVIDSIVIECNAGRAKWATGWWITPFMRVLIDQSNLIGMLDLSNIHAKVSLTIHTYLVPEYCLGRHDHALPGCLWVSRL